MPATDVTLIITRKLPEAVEQRMQEFFTTTINTDDTPLSKEQLIAAVQTAEILVPTVTDVIDAEVINAAGPKLRLIANFGVGVDHIDLEAAQEKNILVTNTPNVLTEDTADMAMTLILAVPRRVHEGEVLARSGSWPGWAPTQMRGMRVTGKRLGIIGMGRIGQAVARRARGFGLSIHYHNRTQLHSSIEEELAATYYPTPEALLPNSDILTLHCPYTPATHHLLNKERLALLPSPSFVINTSRGAVIDQSALITALQDGTVTGAGLDVYEKEPFIDPELIALENALLMPHMSSATHEARTEMAEKVFVNIMCFLDGHRPPPDRVILESAA